jgi:FMN phosphatase YigB (HAD superfamily)
MRAVLFDFQGTLAQVEAPDRAVALAAEACGVLLDPGASVELGEALVAAGWVGPGGSHPVKLPHHLADVWEGRDLSMDAHRAAYGALGDTLGTGIAGLGAALYQRFIDPDGWIAYEDTVPTLRRLSESGVRVAVVSNIGFDMRPLAEAMGFAPYVDGYALSYELGCCKPDPEIFTRACELVGAKPEQALMVGDNMVDAGAVRAGCLSLVLPASPAGAVHGLSAVFPLVERVPRSPRPVSANRGA